ncbi:transforming growth factor beta activator LRRC32-like [Anopheles moucheti]|uniref:transforming growth factor beta activator LRRC32-like n=1 Tax=Anopheles moucheti TaxID=186751 RepID=UPI0022F04CA8|nr:transforming growth factor beta activator LRRC32-like [Anopheles moucheti]
MAIGSLKWSNLWLHIQGPSIVHSARQTCILQVANCIYDRVNVSAGGLQQLRATVRESATISQITVQRLITPYPDGVLLLLVSEFVVEFVYERYKERILRIPPNAMLEDMRVKSAPELQTIIVVAPNKQLISLQINQAALASVPDSLRNLPELTFLNLDNGALERLSLDPFDNSPNITSLSCSGNKIVQLVVSRNADLSVPLVDLMLSYNLLESIDGDFFRPLRMLRFVSFENNRIQRIEGGPISLPRVTYISFVENCLSTLDVSQWHLPLLVEMFFESNNLTRVPIGIERLSNMTTLMLQSNRLTVVDLRRFDGWAKLEKIDLTGNRLSHVFVSGTGRVSLPNLTMMHLSENQLTQLDYARWNFPQLATLTLTFNQLHQLPDLFQIFPKLRRVYAFKNPLRCSTVRRWEQYILNYKLFIDVSAFAMSCATNGTYILPSGQAFCCVEY